MKPRASGAFVPTKKTGSLPVIATSTPIVTVAGALDSELGAYVRRELAKADMIAMDRCWDVSFKTMTSSTA